jgi:hypothetical protein
LDQHKDAFCEQKTYALFVAVTLCDITSSRTPLATATVEDNLLGVLGLLEPELLLERLRAQPEGIGQDGEGNIDGGWDRSLGNLVGFPDIDEEGILSSSSESG